MVTEGIITEIDYSTNKCFVRIPVFENVNSPDKIIIEGRISIQPGSYNGYKINDSVWVDFVDNKLEQPLIIGKIYQGPTKEDKSGNGHMTLDSLTITGTNVELPKETKITDGKTSKSISYFINQIKDLEIKIDQKDATIKELKKDLNVILKMLGTNITDSAGNILVDLNNEILQYKDTEELD